VSISFLYNVGNIGTEIPSFTLGEVKAMKWLLVGATVAYELWKVWNESQKDEPEEDQDDDDDDTDVIE